MAVPTVVGVGAPDSGAGDVTPTKHASVTTGDDNWLAVEANGNQVPTSLTDWTLVDSSTVVGAGSTGIALFHQKEAGQGNPTIADAGNHLFAVILTTRGGDATTPVNASADDREEVVDTTGSSPGVTTTVNDCLVVDFAATSLDSTTPAWSSWTNASLDFTGLGPLFAGGTDAGSGGGIAIHAGSKATAGVVSATTMTTPNDHKAFVKLAIAPTADVGTPIEKDITPGLETDTAGTLTKIKSSLVSAAAEADTAVGLLVSKTLSLSPSATTGAAQAITLNKAATVAAAAETGTALPLSITKTIFKTLTPATETNAAVELSLTAVTQVDLTPVAETDAAQALSFTKTIFKTLTPASETGAAQALSFTQAGSVTLSPAVEVDQAQQLSITKTIFKTLGIAVENDVAASLTFTGGGVQPTTAHYDQPSPTGGTDEGTPGAGHFDQPHPGKVLV